MTRILRFLLAGVFLLATACDDDDSPVDPGDPDPDPSITIQAPSTTVPIIQTVQLTATVEPATLGQGVTWSSSDEDIATVEDGLVYGVRIGTVTITATSQADSNLSASIEMEVAGPLVCTSWDPLPLPNFTTEDMGVLPGCYEYDNTKRVQAAVLIEGPAEIRSIDESAGIRVDEEGELRVIGLDENPVIFTSDNEEPGAWPGIRVGSDEANRLEHVVVEYAGRNVLGFHVGTFSTGVRVESDANLELDHVTIQGTSAEVARPTAGLFLHRGAVVEMTGENRFVENEGPPVHVTAPQIPMLNAESDYGAGDGENGLNVVVVNDDLTSAPPTVEESGTWPAVNVPYRLVRTAFIEGSGTVVTVAPGAVVQGTEGAGIRVQNGGAFRAMGTEDAPVRLTAADGGPGSWPGLRISSATENRLEHTILEYAGNYDLSFHGGPYNTGIRLESGGNLELENATIRATATDPNRFSAGLFLARDATLEMTGVNRFVENDGVPVHVTAPQIPMLSGESVYGGDGDANGIDVVAVNDDSTGSPPTVTEGGTWQALNVPYRIVRAITIQGSEAVITVEPGARFQAMSDAGIRVDGGAGFTAVGEEEEERRIVFSGVETAAGAWPGFHINSPNAANEFRYTIIEHAGENSNAFNTVGGGGITTGVRVGDGVNEGVGGGTAAQLTFFDNIVRNGEGSSMRIEHSGTMTTPSVPLLGVENDLEGGVDDAR